MVFISEYKNESKEREKDNKEEEKNFQDKTAGSHLLYLLCLRYDVRALHLKAFIRWMHCWFISLFFRPLHLKLTNWSKSIK